MGDTRGKETVIVCDMWWDGGNFHVVDKNGKYLIFKNAYYIGYNKDENDDIVKSEEIIIKWQP